MDLLIERNALSAGVFVLHLDGTSLELLQSNALHFRTAGLQGQLDDLFGCGIGVQVGIEILLVAGVDTLGQLTHDPQLGLTFAQGLDGGLHQLDIGMDGSGDHLSLLIPAHARQADMAVLAGGGHLEVQVDHQLQLAVLHLFPEDIAHIVLIEGVAAVDDPRLDAMLGIRCRHGLGGAVEHISERETGRCTVGQLRHVPPVSALIAHAVLTGIGGQAIAQVTDVAGQGAQQRQRTALQIAVIPLVVGSAVHDVQGLDGSHLTGNALHLVSRHVSLFLNFLGGVFLNHILQQIEGRTGFHNAAVFQGNSDLPFQPGIQGQIQHLRVDGQECAVIGHISLAIGRHIGRHGQTFHIGSQQTLAIVRADQNGQVGVGADEVSVIQLLVDDGTGHAQGNRSVRRWLDRVPLISLGSGSGVVGVEHQQLGTVLLGLHQEMGIGNTGCCRIGTKHHDVLGIGPTVGLQLFALDSKGDGCGHGQVAVHLVTTDQAEAVQGCQTDHRALVDMTGTGHLDHYANGIRTVGIDDAAQLLAGVVQCLVPAHILKLIGTGGSGADLGSLHTLGAIDQVGEGQTF